MHSLPGWIRRPLLAPWLTFSVFLLICVVAGLGTQALYFRGDYKVFFEDTNSQKLAYEEMQNTFNKSDNVSFLIVPTNANVYQASTLNLVAELTDLAWQIPFSLRVESLANYQHTYADEDELIVENLYEVEGLSSPVIQTIESVASNTPEVAGRLVGLDGRATVVDVTLQLPEGDQTQDVATVMAHAREIQQQVLAKYPNHDIRLTGVAPMNEAFTVAAKKDGSTLVPLMFVVITMVIGLLTNSIWAALATLFVVATTIIITMGIAGWLGIFLSTATVNVPVMVTTLAVADCIHIIVGYFQNLLKTDDKAGALEESLAINKRPILITSITTAIGFLMLNFSEVPILADLGNLTAIGVMLACFISLCVLPILLIRIPAAKIRIKSPAVYGKLGKFVATNFKKILPLSVVILALSCTLAMNNQLNDVAVKYFDNASVFRQAVNIHEQHFGGMSNIDFVVYTDTENGVNEPEVLNRIDEFADWLRQQPETNHVLSFSDTMKRLGMNMQYDDEAFYKIPDSKALAAQYLLLYEMSLPYGLDVNNQIDIDKSAIRLVAVLDNLGSKEFTEFETRAKSKFKSLLESYRLEAASPALMFAHIGKANMQSMVWGTVLALVLISLLIVFALKSIRLGMVSLLTNLVPAGLGFGLWAVISAEINMALSVVLSMTLGIIVDDTVHFLSKYQRTKLPGRSVREAIVETFNGVGQPLATTTVVLACGFGVLTLSDFALNSDMGLLTVIIIVGALIVDFLFLPAFLMWLDRDDNSIKGEQNHVEPA